MEIAVGSELGMWQKRSRDAHLSEALAPDIALLAVADGFGNVGRAPVAEAAVAHVRDFLRRKMRSGALASRAISPLNLRQIVLAAFAHANARLFSQSGSTDDYVAGGASLTVAMIVGNTAYVGHVGDARAYLIREDAIEALTEDDAISTDVEVTVSGAPPAPRHGSLLTRTLGSQPTLEATVTRVELRRSDRLVLCTDGVHKTLDDDELEDAIATGEPAAETVARVLSLVRSRGASDCGTVIVGCRLTEGADVVLEQPASYRLVGALALSLLLLIAVFIAALLYTTLLAPHIP